MYTIMLVNFIYAIASVTLGVFAGRMAVKLMDRTTPYDLQEQLASDNRSIGIVVAGIYIGVSIMIGLIIGLSVN